MALQTFTSGEVLSATKLQAVSNQTVITCTSGSRPSSPVEGMLVSESDTGFIRRWDGSKWRAFPFGIVVDTESSGTGDPYAISGTPVDLNTDDPLTFDAVGSQRYVYQGWVRVACSQDSNVVSFNHELDGSSWAAADQIDVFCRYLGNLYNAYWRIVWAPTTGTHTITTQVNLAVGAGLAAVKSGGSITIEHLGSLP